MVQAVIEFDAVREQEQAATANRQEVLQPQRRGSALGLFLVEPAQEPRREIIRAEITGVSCLLSLQVPTVTHPTY